MKVRINAISSEGIDQYNMLRIGPGGEHLPISGIDWQDSDIFTGMPTGGGWVLQVRDVKGNMAEKIVPKEDPLEILMPSGQVIGAEIIVSWYTNIPSRGWIDWGFNQDVSNSTEETEEYKHIHKIAFPSFNADALHYFRCNSRSKGGQLESSPVLWTLTLGEVEFYKLIMPAVLNTSLVEIQGSTKKTVSSLGLSPSFNPAELFSSILMPVITSNSMEISEYNRTETLSMTASYEIN